MFVLSEPCISDFLVETIKKNSYPVLKTKMAEGINQKEFALEFLKYKKVYTNSENSIEILEKIFENADFINTCKLFKNKTEFRKLLKDIYPDFFYTEVLFEDLKKIDRKSLKYPFVIKPSVGFLSMGVYTVWNESEFDSVIEKILNEKNNKAFPKSVLDTGKFLIEEFIEGEEFAVDIYYNDIGEPVILNIFKHPFSDKYDVSDRMYVTSKAIIDKNSGDFNILFEKIGKITGLKNFPMHIELRKEKDKIIPIEINPLRFAGWCTCDIAYYAYGINLYECFMENKKPDLKGDNSIFAFVMGEVPIDIKKGDIISFDIKAFMKDTNAEILEKREFDYKTKPMFCVLFIKARNYEQIEGILKLDMKKYIRTAESAF